MKYILFKDGVLNSRYDSQIHGERLIEDQNYQFDPYTSVDPPTIIYDNPDCKIPTEAIEVEDELFYRTINEQDGIWSLVNDKIVKLPLPEPPLDNLKASAMTRIDQAHAEFLLKAVGNPTQVEINTWSLKLGIKNKLLSSEALNASESAFLNAAGFDTAEKQTAWAQSVEAKAAFSAHCTGVAENVRDQAKAAVAAAKSAAALDKLMTDLAALAESKLADVVALKG